MTKDEVLKLALEAFGEIAWSNETQWQRDRAKEAITAIKEALAQEQEPVAFYVYKPTLPRGSLGNVSDGDLPWVYDQDPSSGYSARMLVYITPPQRTWVGLTDEEVDECYYWKDRQWTTDELVRHVEAKLKEKNGA